MAKIIPTPPHQEDPRTAYEKAYIEWSARIGDARLQSQNWQRIGMLSLAVLILFLLVFVTVVSMKKTYVYVAQATPDKGTVLVQLPQSLKASSAQQAYFVNQFITDIMSLPLDPVIARQNWFNAFDFVSGQAVGQLTAYAQNNNPLQQLGQITKSVQINNFNAVSDQSIRFTWTVTSYNNQGQIENQITQSGIFTVSQAGIPDDQTELLKNPFGLKISYFSINNEGSSP